MRFVLTAAALAVAGVVVAALMLMSAPAAQASPDPTYGYDRAVHLVVPTTARIASTRSIEESHHADLSRGFGIWRLARTSAPAVARFLAPQTPVAGGECDNAAWVIGESSRRTEAAAVAFGAQVWPGPPADATHYEACAANEAWLRGAIASAARIIDIGIDSSRQGSRSPYYELELRIVAKTGYPVERRPWPPSPTPYTPQDDGPCP